MTVREQNNVKISSAGPWNWGPLINDVTALWRWSFFWADNYQANEVKRNH
jgi:hypothetical protein